MKRTIVFCIAALLAAPALAAQQPNAPNGRSAPAYEVNLPGGAVWVRLDTVSASVMAPGDRTSVFRAAVQVFQALKIKTGVPAGRHAGRGWEPSAWSSPAPSPAGACPRGFGAGIA